MRNTHKAVNTVRSLLTLGGFVATPVFIGANLLVGNVVHGPAMIEEEISTIVVFPV